MSQLELVISEIEKLPPDEQNQFVAWILEELHSEERWSKSFEESSNVLSHLADEAVEEYKAKKTHNLDPDSL
jgi:aspartate/tyrosine/aromatic aminotransferase